jgi:hypothetical protein
MNLANAEEISHTLAYDSHENIAEPQIPAPTMPFLGVCVPLQEVTTRELWRRRVRYNCLVTRHPCTRPAEWRLQRGSRIEHLPSYYQLPCDHGRAVMLSWENGGNGPVYLCETHADLLGGYDKDSEESLPQPPRRAAGNQPADGESQAQSREVTATNLKSFAPPAGPADAQVETAAKIETAKKDSPVRRTTVCDIAPGDSPKALLNEAIANITSADSDVHSSAPQRMKPSSTMVEKEAERADVDHLCLSRYGERCSCEAVVHCPKCGRWYCDAHAEEEKWHSCALPM